MTFVETLIGGYIICFAIGCIFYGITIAQAYAYFSSCERDAAWMKWLAAAVIFLETVHSAVYLRQMYVYSVLALSNPLNLFVIDWSVPTSIILEIVLEVMIYGFYIHRMWTFSKNIPLAIGTVLVFLAQTGTLLFCTAKITTAKTWINLENPVTKSAVLASLSFIIALTITISVVMVYYLRRNRSMVQRTRGVLSWLILYYVNSGVILATIAIVILITYLVAPNSLLYGGFIQAFGKLVANSFFGLLNSRQILRDKMAKPVVIGTNVFSTSLGSFALRMENSSSSAGRESVSRQTKLSKPVVMKDSTSREDV
ncbi:hypothetical protein QCA50_013151 [Cerrena zonata]|uniref:DUF6534 domain-containing protein n=1 Tax=Cerrena zonata TaxID=2478898 RepID=A0AAW0FR43_9APHY